MSSDYPEYPCCGGLVFHRGGEACDEYKFPGMGPPKAVPAPAPAVWDLVMADMRERDRVDVSTYGQRLTRDTPIDALRYAYEEMLDGACYLRKAMLERDGK